MPVDFHVCHESLVGTVNVSIHAWQRFYLRYIVRPRDCESAASAEEFFARQFRRSFARSQEIFLEPKYQVLRIINNDCQQACYFYDRATDTRFVLQEERGHSDRWFVITAERPKPK